jgi:hypothetical protein
MAFGTGYAPARSNRNGYAGFVGSSLIFIAVLSMVWAGLDATTDLRSWLTLSFELFGGLILSVMFGFSFMRRANLSRSSNLQSESQAVMLGVFFGSIVVIIEFLAITASELASTSEGVWLSLMAPAAETMLAVVAVYQLLTSAFPKMHWIFKAVASDIVFGLFHFFHYGSDPKWLVILLVLAVGNTFFVWAYHVTRNATAPMVAHLMVNLVPNSQNVLEFIVLYGPLLIIMFVSFFFIFKFFGGRHR